MLLTVKDVIFNYDKLEVLQDINMSIDEGGINVLLGANGAGKTTLLKLVSGLLKPLSGSIEFKGKRIEKLSPPNRLKLGIAHIAEGRGIFRNMTVLENMELGAYLVKDHKKAVKEIEDLFERFPVLGKKRNVASGKLSGGEQQMLVIARALMNEVQLLLLDEPSQGLAPLIVNEVANVITEINKTGVTILLVEHNIRLGLNLASKIFILENGKIDFEGKASELSGDEYAKRIYLGS
jgi:branched-chain amino acid transport system ATP-binding protein